jgi:hypothetical protein
MSEPYAAAGAPWGREAGDLGPAKAASPALFFISVPSRDLWNLLTVFVTVYRTPSPRGRRVTHTRRAALSGPAGAARASSHALVYLLAPPTHQYRYRGLSKTRLQHLTTAAAININRLAALICSLIMRPIDMLGFACIDRRHDER